ncbi:MAG TPA: hypothetical protein H9821_03205 [Candidatus Rothia avicola]|uniref:DUF6318 domain-containing protein n=1 Tax=Candidatus Rothia avicola TaxID=2840478 RepID=A0A9D1ZV80_9MICC|nr:hypothetical protein [Candidatus Rothia avicola]
MKHAPTRNLALTAIALLALTGCGAQATGSVPEPNPSTTTSAVTSSTASAAEETAKAEETNYSGGSKAPEGEYRAADEHGPAQNVPKPVAPEGMNIESTEAMLLFINYWNDMRNYANQTGDISSIRGLVDDSFEQEQKYYDSLQKIYESGGWVIGGNRTIHYNKDLLIAEGEGKYSIASNFELENTVLWYNGEARAYDNSQNIYRGIMLTVQFDNGSWRVTKAIEVS